MISMVVPTRNRAHTLQLVAPSYFSQELVSEIIFVEDHGQDETPELIRALATRYPSVSTRIVRNGARLGASQSRNVGAGLVVNDYVLFCDDDEYLEPGYAKICLGKLISLRAGAVSGRRIYMTEAETPSEAIARFGHGIRRIRPFHPLICEIANGAYFTGDLKIPFTNAIILTRTELLRRFPFDPYYAKGNGYREETDFQMNLFVNGYDIFVTNDCHSIHLPLRQVLTGGQRTSRAKRIYWAIFYTRYFFRKYFDRYAHRMGINVPQSVALTLFAGFAMYKETVRPVLHDIALAMLRVAGQAEEGARRRTGTDPPAGAWRS